MSRLGVRATVTVMPVWAATWQVPGPTATWTVLRARGRRRRTRTPEARTRATGPSSRSVTRCPASGSPALMMRSPRLTLPDALTVRAQEQARGHIHLPQLHRRRPLPAPIGVRAAAPGHWLDHVVADQDPV